MSEPRAYLNGRWVTPAALTLSIHDAGFVLGATVTEQMRTFDGQIFRLDDHLDRFDRGLQICQLDLGLTRDELKSIAEEVVALNWPHVEQDGDLGLGMFVTPGVYGRFAGGVISGPTLCVYCYELQFSQWAHLYEEGQPLVVSDIRQIPQQSLPVDLKCRSRMHYYLADLAAAQAEPGSRALLLDAGGNVNEGTTASLVCYREQQGLVAPPAEKVLPGISERMLKELADELDIACVRRDIRPEELFTADELMLTSTSVCVLPVTRVDGRDIADGLPGPIYRQLLAAWSDHVGIDIAAQAQKFSQGQL